MNRGGAGGEASETYPAPFASLSLRTWQQYSPDPPLIRFGADHRRGSPDGWAEVTVDAHLIRLHSQETCYEDVSGIQWESQRQIERHHYCRRAWGLGARVGCWRH